MPCRVPLRRREEDAHFPWANGLKADEIYDCYQAAGFRDWVHAESGASVLKAQHPEFEMWNQGIHARAGVTCADCQMPYRREGGFKVSDHQVRSPLLNVSASCQTCHRVAEEDRAHTIQQRTFEMRSLAMDAVVALIGDIGRARAGGASDADLAAAREQQRKAQFFLDFIEAENSMGFHADQEAMRILALSIDAARLGQLALRDPEAARTATASAAPMEAPTPGG